MITLSTVKAVNMPREVIFVWAAVVNVTSAIYVLIRDAAVFLLVPAAPSSTINKSVSARRAPISVASSIFRSSTAIEPLGKFGVPEKVILPFAAIVIAAGVVA
jgi:hypothetical protein